ncbi:hypothetical protein [Streptosporangium sp. NPDC023615]|uniref:hypothetical protein n=1 Tax=Streptosporangium sp. NPDC023615 TaxID=3154794 RepID=UPI003426456D
MRGAMALTATPFCVAVATMSVTPVTPSDPLRLASGRIPAIAVAAGPAPPAAARATGHPHRPTPAGCRPDGPAGETGVRRDIVHDVPVTPEPAPGPAPAHPGGVAAPRGAARDTQVSLVLLALALAARAVFMRRRRPDAPAGPPAPEGGVT